MTAYGHARVSADGQTLDAQHLHSITTERLTRPASFANKAPAKSQGFWCGVLGTRGVRHPHAKTILCLVSCSECLKKFAVGAPLHCRAIAGRSAAPELS
jgi:hypothetical protein